MIKGEDIKRLIPQRNPMMMVDEFEASGDTTAVTALSVRPDNMFVNDRGELAESGLIEHMAQSASALAGHLRAGDRPPVGIIGEVKHFECHRRPLTGDRIVTVVTFRLSFAGATIAHAVSRIDGERVAEAHMKIFIS